VVVLAEHSLFVIFPDLLAGRAVAASAAGPSPMVATAAPAKAVAILNDLFFICFSSGPAPWPYPVAADYSSVLVRAVDEIPGTRSLLLGELSVR